VIAVKLDDNTAVAGFIVKINVQECEVRVPSYPNRIVLINWVKSYMVGNLLVHRSDRCYNRTLVIRQLLKKAPSLLKACGRTHVYVTVKGNWYKRVKVKGRQYDDGFFIPTTGQRFKAPIYFNEKNKLKQFIWKKD
jgi:hypothetical protein